MVVWVQYRDRDDAENRVGELNYDFEAGSFNLGEFHTTETAIQFVMIAYNPMNCSDRSFFADRSDRRFGRFDIRYFRPALSLFGMNTVVYSSGHVRCNGVDGFRVVGDLRFARCTVCRSPMKFS